ncbi:MAG: DUF2064 domain-containing protein [Mycobacterium sp.]|nr:DUF2064 domain-containing protein [Mycobacterium sp.]
MTEDDCRCAVTILVVAKAPVPGLAKTRLAASVGDRAAAEIAAAALLDTLDAVAGTPADAHVVALTGDLDRAARCDEIRSRLTDFTVVTQRGDGFADRLANAHTDAAAAGLPVLQIGMDTPQVTAALLTRCAHTLLAGPAVLGPATDGGWWALGVHAPEHAQCLRTVPMSQPDTGAVTLGALRDTGITVSTLRQLRDVDTIDDIAPVRAECAPGSRFTRATAMCGV